LWRFVAVLPHVAEALVPGATACGDRPPVPDSPQHRRESIGFAHIGLLMEMPVLLQTIKIQTAF
jgi:hypothetical protein